ncbi:putative ribonuclease H-like domain-containing protein [Tanacetum coccineum]
MTDATEMWEAIKSRFGGNEESKKNKANDNSKRLRKKEESNALMTLDGGCVDWTSHSEKEEDYALMACNNCSVETHESLSEPIVNEPKVVNQPKVWSDAPIIEEYVSDSQAIICDKKKKVLFTLTTNRHVLAPEFNVNDEVNVLLRIPRQNNMLTVEFRETIVPSGGLACLITKAKINESNKWHRRLGHVNFKNLNKLVKGNLVRGLPSKIFQNDHTCVACQKGKQHKASCKAKSVSDSISTRPYSLLHMDLSGPNIC